MNKVMQQHTYCIRVVDLTKKQEHFQNVHGWESIPQAYLHISGREDIGKRLRRMSRFRHVWPAAVRLDVAVVTGTSLMMGNALQRDTEFQSSFIKKEIFHYLVQTHQYIIHQLVVSVI